MTMRRTMTSESKRHPALYVLVSALAVFGPASVLAACGGDKPAPKDNPTFASCAEAEKAGYRSMKKGEAGYSAKLDADGDGLACDKP